MLLQQRVNNIFKRLTSSFSAETTKCNFLVFASFVLLKLKFDSLKLKSNFFQSDRKYDFFTISVINVQCSNMKRRIKCTVKGSFSRLCTYDCQSFVLFEVYQPRYVLTDFAHPVQIKTFETFPNRF